VGLPLLLLPLLLPLCCRGLGVGLGAAQARLQRMPAHALRGLQGTGGQKGLSQRFGLHDVARHGIRMHTFLHITFAGFRTGFLLCLLGLGPPLLLFRCFLWFRAALLSTCGTLLGSPRGPPSRLCPLEPGCAELRGFADTRLSSRTYLLVCRESASSVAVSSRLALLLPGRLPCLCSSAAVCARRRSGTGWLGGRC